MINKNITTKKNFDDHKILILYYFITSWLKPDIGKRVFHTWTASG